MATKDGCSEHLQVPSTVACLSLNNGNANALEQNRRLRSSGLDLELGSGRLSSQLRVASFRKAKHEFGMLSYETCS